MDPMGFAVIKRIGKSILSQGRNEFSRSPAFSKDGTDKDTEHLLAAAVQARLGRCKPRRCCADAGALCPIGVRVF